MKTPMSSNKSSFTMLIEEKGPGETTVSPERVRVEEVPIQIPNQT